jgi:hypothetical protein
MESASNEVLVRVFWDGPKRHHAMVESTWHTPTAAAKEVREANETTRIWMDARSAPDKLSKREYGTVDAERADARNMVMAKVQIIGTTTADPPVSLSPILCKRLTV